MSISRIGTASIEATTITIPGTYQNGDLAIIFAFSSVLATPALPGGWTNFASGAAGGTGIRVGFKILTSASDTSGTWTSATGLVCHVYRGVATNRVPLVLGSTQTATTATINYGNVGNISGRDSWVVAFAATNTTTSTIETPPTNLTLQTNLVGAATEYAGFDSNGAFTIGKGNWPFTAVAVGTSAEWRSATLQVFAENSSPYRNKGIRPHPFSPGLAR